MGALCALGTGPRGWSESVASKIAQIVQGPGLESKVGAWVANRAQSACEYAIGSQERVGSVLVPGAWARGAGAVTSCASRGRGRRLVSHSPEV